MVDNLVLGDLSEREIAMLMIAQVLFMNNETYQ